MSDTTHDARATEPSATESQTDSQPETETAPGAETTTPTEEKPADPPKPAPDPRDRAIRQLAFEQRETRRQLQAAREQLERNQPPRDPNAPPSQADFERQVQERAQALNEERASLAKNEAWIVKGQAEYTPEVFNEQCNELARMGAGDNPVFMSAVNELPDAHKVVAELATNPGEATRILGLPPLHLTLALSAIANRIASTPPPAAKPTTQAPPPIRPLQTTARAEVNLSNLDGAAFRSAFLKQYRTRG